VSSEAIRCRIDPHVHCRDGVQSYKETIAHVLKVADEQGVYAVFDMPNTDPPIIRKVDVEARLKYVPKSGEGRYFLYVGATADEGQLREAVKCYDEFSEVVGIKMFAGSSTGDLAIINEKEQMGVYSALAETGYRGVLAVHCEKEDRLRPKAWDTRKPITHCRARPVDAEIASVDDQIRFAKEAGFEGNLHICHTTCPKVVRMVEEARKEMRITCGVTPHHMLWIENMMDRPEGALYKMNPPLRSREIVEGLRIRVLGGKVDWIETDHAPHALGEKLHTSCPPSGYPSLYIYKEFLRILKEKGMKDEQIDAMTYHNIKKAFGHKVA
jgi:dihydroorotase